MFNWIPGFRRRQSGISVALFVFGGLGCCLALGMMLVGVPASITRALEVRGLPRPAPADLGALPPGTQALVVGQVPLDAPAGPNGLALYYVEYRVTGTAEPGGSRPTPAGSRTWQLEEPPPPTVELLLLDQAPISVRLSPQTTFMNAQRFEAGEAQGAQGQLREYRYVGYGPGQALTVDGAWEGNGLMTARALYAGTPDDYAASLARQPGQMLMMGAICGALALAMLIGGAVLRLLGR